MGEGRPGLAARGIVVRARGAVLVDGADLDLRPGELVALLGPNGAGKTTLLRAALGLLRPAAGSAMIDGGDAARMAPAARARRIAYLPQVRPLAWPSPVRDVVALGRYAHGAASGRLGAEDAAAVGRALNACDLGRLADRRTDTLSGGELARVHCARALAAEASLLVADEPVASLDPRHQFQVMDVVRRFVDGGGGALVVLHDIPLAACYADRVVLLHGGRVVASGPVGEVLDAARLREVFGVRAEGRGEGIVLYGSV